MVEAKKASVEEQLIQYRKRKRKEEEFSALKQRIWEYFSVVFTFWRKSSRSTVTVNTVGGAGGGEEQQEPYYATQNAESRMRKGRVREDSTTQEDEPPPPPTHYTTLDWVMLLLKVLMWLLLQKVFILLEFGAVYFIFSAFLFIWYNLRNEPKKKGEASAYSVFNPNCEVIDGTFTAEQFERELLHKM